MTMKHYPTHIQLTIKEIGFILDKQVGIKGIECDRIQQLPCYVGTGMVYGCFCGPILQLILIVNISTFLNEFKPDAVRSKDRKVERNEVTQTDIKSS